MNINALTGKAADAVILTAPYTSMSTLAGYVDLGDTFDVRDVQGGLVGRVSHIQNHREQIKAVLRAVLRSNEMILKNDAEVIPFIQKEFGLEQNVAADSYRQIKKVLNADGDIEEPVLKSILDKIRQESGIAAEIPADRLSIFRFSARQEQSYARDKVDERQGETEGETQAMRWRRRKFYSIHPKSKSGKSKIRSLAFQLSPLISSPFITRRFV